MSSKLTALRRRRELLISQAALQRSDVAHNAFRLQQHLRLADKGFAMIQSLRTHSILLASSVALLLPAPRSKMMHWSSRFFSAWVLIGMARKQWQSLNRKKS